MPEDVRAVTLCRAFGWTEADYLDTTVAFSDKAIAIIVASTPERQG